MFLLSLTAALNAAFSILITWSFTLIVFSGIGFLILKLIGMDNVTAEMALAAFWLGWSFTLALLQIWHFFAPIGISAALTVSLLGILGLVLRARRLTFEFAKSILANKLPFAVSAMCFLVFSLLLANRAAGPIQPYDAGLYHLGAIRWTQSYPIIPGLGNLHGRLAFNSSYFLFLAMLDVGPWFHRSFHLAAGLLLLVTSLQSGLYIGKAIVNRSSLQSYQVLGIMLAIPLVALCFTDASSTSVDLPIFILGVIVGTRLFKTMFHDNTPDDILFSAIFIVTLSVIGISIKLSFIVFGCLSSLLAVLKLITSTHSISLTRTYRQAVWIFVLIILVLIPWMIRDVMLSGYIAYPVSLVSFDVAWKVPESQALGDAKAIESWARAPGKADYDKVLGNWDWFIPWALEIKGDRLNFILPLLLLLIGTIFSLGRGKSNSNSLFLYFLFMIPSIASLIFWFFTAPSVRFAGAAFWLLGAGAMAMSICRQNKQEYQEAVLVMAFLSIGFIGGWNMGTAGLYLHPGPDQGFYPIPTAETSEFQTSSGVTVYVPRERNQCWEAPLPCTPYPNLALRLIEDGKISSGFTVNSR